MCTGNHDDCPTYHNSMNEKGANFMRERRNLLLWLIPLAILALIFLPPIVSSLVYGEEQKPEVVEKPKTEKKEPEVEKEEKEQVVEEEEHLRKPVLELTTRTIVNLKKGSKVDYKAYIKTATDSHGKDSSTLVKWTEVDNSYTETAQGITYSFTDTETGEELTDILLVQFK